MSERRRIPIGSLWSMRIDVPYSLMAREGSFAWSCGQVPLDAEARVLSPGDIKAQSRHLCGYIREILGRVGLGPEAVGKLVAYHLGGAAEARAMTARLRDGLGDTPLILPVAVPHFYYDGLMLEVDVHASSSTQPGRREVMGEGVRLEIVEADGLCWASVEAEGTREVGMRIADTLAACGLGGDRLLCDHWIMPDPAVVKDIAAAGLASDPGAAVRMPGEGVLCRGELTFASGPVAVSLHGAPGSTVIARSQGPFLWVSSRTEEGGGLVDQTRTLMQGIETALAAHGASFRDVVKSTTHYVAGGSEEELHDNMAVRNARYSKPGPASTGVPVAGLGDARSLTAVDVLALRRS